MADDERGRAKDVGDYEWGRRHEVEARLGDLHEARNGITGTPALALVPRGDVEWRPAGPCQLRLTYAPDRGAVTLDVERAPASVRTFELTNLLVLVTALFQRVEEDAAVEAHLASGPVRRAAPERPRPVRASRRAVALAGLAGLAAGLGVWLFAGQVLSRPETLDCTWAIEDAQMRETDFIDLDKPGVEALMPVREKDPVPQSAKP